VQGLVNRAQLVAAAALWKCVGRTRLPVVQNEHYLWKNDESAMQMKALRKIIY
jgi:hypothetical protein